MSRASDYGGYACPKCGGKTTVMDSRLDEHGIKRRRYCKDTDCAHRFTTIEAEVTEYRSIATKPIATMLRAAADAVEGLTKP